MVTYPKSNVGRMHSVGSDGNIEFFHQINKDMNFTIRANYTFSQNVIDYFEENKLPYDYLSVTGKPFNILRGYISEGCSPVKEINTSPDQSGFGTIRPGDIKYRDVNGDGIINEDDKVPLSYSNQLPRMMYGFGGDFQWKDLTVSILFKGSAKVDYYRAGLGNDYGWIPFYNGDLGNVIKLANNPKNRWTLHGIRELLLQRIRMRNFHGFLMAKTRTTPSFLLLETERVFPAPSGSQSEIQPETSAMD